MAQLAWRCLASADRLPVVIRIPAGPLRSLKCDPPKGNGRRPKKNELGRSQVEVQRRTLSWEGPRLTIMKQPFQFNLQPRFKNRIEPPTQTQPLVAKHIGGTIRAPSDRSCTRRAQTRYLSRRLQPLDTKNKVWCSGFLPVPAAIAMRSATTLHQGQVSIAHEPSRSSLNRTPPFKVKS